MLGELVEGVAVRHVEVGPSCVPQGGLIAMLAVVVGAVEAVEHIENVTKASCNGCGSAISGG